MKRGVFVSEAKGSKFSLTTLILISLVLGLIFGMILNYAMAHSGVGVRTFIEVYIVNGVFHVVGKIFIAGIKMLVVPLVLASLITGVAGIGDLKKLGRVGGKTLLFYMLTTGIAVTLALVIAKLIGPGVGLNLVTPETSFSTKDAPSLVDVIINIIPTNPFDALVKGEMLQVIFFSLLMGISIASIGKKADGILTFFQEFNEIIMNMITLIMLLAPIGVFCLIAKVFATQGLSVLVPLIKYMITVFVVLILHLFLTYGGFLTVLGRLSMVTFLKKFYSTMLVAFSTASSNATIPVTMKALVDRMGVGRSVASFSVPFGATINMDGTAIMQGVAVVFISQVYGIDLTLSDFLMVIMTATLASVGTAGVPGVGLITLSMVLTQVGLPVEGIALIIGVDRLLDMTRTAVNISGDAIISIIVAKSEDEFKADIYADPDAGLYQEDEFIHELEEHMQESHELLEADEQRRLQEKMSEKS